MVESQKSNETGVVRTLIDRLGMALDAAKTAGRLRDERPVELELRGLSPAEFELIKAYLDRSGREAHGCLSAVCGLIQPRSSGSRTRRPAESRQGSVGQVNAWQVNNGF
jgi:hypothetical protein